MMAVRGYRTGDSIAVKNLILSIMEKEYPFDRSAYRDTDINDISGIYSGRDSAFFVAESDGRIVGTVGIKKDSNGVALLRRLFVEEKCRKKGLGTLLIRKALEFCRSKKYKEMVFRATDRMKDAMKLCEKHGFSEKENLEVSGFHIHKFILKL